jgi:hypothetical protein
MDLRKMLGFTLAVATVFVMVGCAPLTEMSSTIAASSQASQKATREVAAASSDYADATTIALGDTIVVNGSGASVSGNAVSITAGGAYRLSGILRDGQIVVNAAKQAVELILNGVDIACSTSAPIYVLEAKKTTIILADGTENRIADGESYVIKDTEANEPNAAIFSKSDLTIMGNGSLSVEANYDHGINSKDELEIAGGTITVHAVADGIRGRDNIVITDGIVTVNAGADGLQSSNDKDPERGFVTIEGGTIAITAGQDGIQAQTKVTIRGGDITLSTGGGSANSSSQGKGWGEWGKGKSTDSSDSAPSAKAIKALVGVTIDGGAIQIDSSDDAIHSNGALTINDGGITAASGDDGIHADSAVTINGGEIAISKSYEGIESAVIEINEGNIHIISSDDGINVVGGVDGSSMGGRPGQNSFHSSGNDHLDINGGYIAVDAMGDGLDINGSINMTAGVLLVNGPISNNNGALDYDRDFKMTGGYLVAAGSSGMAQAPDTSSTQYAVMVNLPAPLQAGTIVHIETDKGEGVLTFAPTKAYQSVVLCSPELKKGATYIVYTGGSATGTVTDSLYSDGAYRAGAQVTSLTISDIVTGAGAVGGHLRRRGP